MSKKLAETTAIQLLKRHHVESLPIDVRALAEAEGVRILEQELEPNISGVLFAQDGRAVIGINRDHHARRQRFTTAHELGHFLLHWRHFADPSPTLFVDGALTFYRDGRSSSGNLPHEIEANVFAAELLMPRLSVEKLMAEVSYDLHDDSVMRKLCGIFGVSEQALTVRLVTLGLLTT